MGGILCTGKKYLSTDNFSDLEGPLVKLQSPGKGSSQVSDSVLQRVSVGASQERYTDSPSSLGDASSILGDEYSIGNGLTQVKSFAQRSESEESFVETMRNPPRPIRWRKGEIIGSGAYGRVYMGMNLDSGELIAVKQVLIAVGGMTNKKAQDHLRSLEEEVDLLRNLSHPNIVRYLGTQREEEALNIFLEFVPGGSISSLLSKFGCFTEKVIKMYTRQILLGLEYLHLHKIMHRDIKGANILVDNKGGIKLADFGASKKLADLATISHGNRSLRGTPYWMAPEVIKQTGHGRQADIWSVGCTVLEMATGKPPWSEYQSDVSALFHIAQSESPPPIPTHLSPESRDFILQCLQRDPKKRPSAAELLQHPFLAVAEDGTFTNGISERSMYSPANVSRFTEQTNGLRDSLEDDGCSLPRGPLSLDTRGSPPKWSPGDSRTQSAYTSERQTATPPRSPRRALYPRYNAEQEANRGDPCSNEKLDYGQRAGSRMKPADESWLEEPRLDSLQFRKGGDLSHQSDGLGGLTAGMSNLSVDMSLRSDFNPMEEPSYREESSTAKGHWDRLSEGEVMGPREIEDQASPSEVNSGRGHTARQRLLFSRQSEGTSHGFPVQASLDDCVNQDSPSPIRGSLGPHIGDSPGFSLDEENVTEDKIKTFLEEKALELTRLQTPLIVELESIRTAGESHSAGGFLDGEGSPFPSSGASPIFPSDSPGWPDPSRRPGSVKRHVSTNSQAVSSASWQAFGDGAGSGPSWHSGSSGSGSSREHHQDPRDSAGSGASMMGSKNGIHGAVPGSAVPREGPKAGADRGQSSAASGSLKKQQWEEELQRELASKREEKRKMSRHGTGSASRSGSGLSSAGDKQSQSSHESYLRSVAR